LLASGKIESVITDPGTEIYDYAAGKLIAMEAGAKLVGVDGNNETEYLDDSFVLSNNEKVSDYILNILVSLKDKK